MPRHPRYSRTRSFGNAEDINQRISYYWSGNPGVLNTYLDRVYSSVRSHRIFTDTTGKRNNELGTRANPCYDVRYDVQCGGFQRFIGDNHRIVDPVGMPHPFAKADVEAMLPSDFSGSKWYDFNLEAITSFSERFPQEISATEFLGGLGDLPRLLPSLQSSITKTIAGNFLSEKFGWENLLRDLQVLGSLTASVQNRLTFLKANRGKPTRLRWSRADVHVPTESDYLVHSNQAIWPRSWDCDLRRTGYRCDVSASAVLVQKLDHLDDTIGLIRGFVGALGLNNPLKSVWELLPFSFVVDWFLKVSTHLTLLATVQPGEEWSLYDVTRTRKETATFEVRQLSTQQECVIPIAGHAESGNYNPVVTLGTIRVTRFSRAVGLPLSPTIFSLTELSPQQLVLLLALLASSAP